MLTVAMWRRNGVCVCVCVCVSIAPLYRGQPGVDCRLKFRLPAEHLDGIDTVPHPVTWLLLGQSRRRQRRYVFLRQVRVNVTQFLQRMLSSLFTM